MENKEHYKHLQTMTIEEYQKYVNEHELGYIRINKHPEDENIVILNYTEMVTFERRWNEQTMASRGLILDLTEAEDNGIIYILAKPFEKFFNFGENLDYEKDIDFNEIETVMEKMDGSLGISYIINGEIRFATRGSFISDQAVKATEIWNRKYELADKMTKRMLEISSITLLVEIIYPENRILVDYNGEEKLVLLGAISDGVDVDYGGVEMLAYHFNLPLTPQLEYTLETMLEMKQSISANEEGWILRFKNGKRLKIKGDEYMHVHRLLHGVSEKSKVRAWATGEMKEYVLMLPEEFRPELELFSDKLDRLHMMMLEVIATIFEHAVSKHPTKKEFALYINSNVVLEYRKFMFNAHKNGVVSEDLIREHIYKNYIEYLEVIK